jgi:hypothetical protein
MAPRAPRVGPGRGRRGQEGEWDPMIWMPGRRACRVSHSGDGLEGRERRITPSGRGGQCSSPAPQATVYGTRCPGEHDTLVHRLPCVFRAWKERVVVVVNL